MGLSFYEFVRLMTTEPYIFLTCFNYALKGTALTQLFQDKICIVDFGYSREICQNLNHANKEYLESVTKVTNNYKIYQEVIQSLPCVFLLFFCGSWVDKYRTTVRRILLLTPLTGLINSLLLALNCYFFHWPTWATLLCALMLTLLGDFRLSVMCAYGQAAKVTPEDMRSIRFTTLDLGVQAGASLGSYCVGYFLLKTPFGPKEQLNNYLTIFLMAAFLHALTIVWVFLVVKNPPDMTSETLNEKPDAEKKVGQFEINEDKDVGWFKKLFDIQLLIRTWQTSAKPRKNHGRLKIWLLLASNAVAIANTSALPVFLFQYVQRTLGWDNRKYGYVNSVTTIGQTLTMISAVPVLSKVFKVQDSTLGIIGAISALFANIIRGSILTEPGYYLSFVVGALATVTPVGIKALLTPLVPPEELGSLYTFLIVAQVTASLALAPIFTGVFSLTMETYPGFVFHFAAVTVLLPLFVFTGFRVSSKRKAYQFSESGTKMENEGKEIVRVVSVSKK